MHLVQLLLPVYDNSGEKQPPDLFAQVRETMAERFGGLTAHTRAPAEGLWRSSGATSHDDIVVFEVMVEQLDRAWWSGYRAELETLFRQETMVVRVQTVELL